MRTKKLWMAAVGLVIGCGGPAGGEDASVGVTCGPVTCGAGEVCCNASCGFCTPPGGSCTEQACIDAGPEPDAGRDAAIACGDETCGGGARCCTQCDGTLACLVGECPICSCGPEHACASDQYCEGDDTSCGEGTCKPRPSGCPEDCPGVCGCDGADYCNACDARANGTDVARDAPCSNASECDAMHATGEGDCEITLGFAFDGGRCVGIHCTCVGADCDALYASSDECEEAYAHCPFTFCGGLAGVPCGEDEYCDYAEPSCGATDRGGVCRPRPADCADEARDPVCACDGNTYDNACLANQAGFGVSSRGACGDPPEGCLSTGCPDGSMCRNCLHSGWTCVPDDMECS